MRDRAHREAWCNRCGRPMLGTTAYDGACACGGLIEKDTRGGDFDFERYLTMCNMIGHLEGWGIFETGAGELNIQRDDEAGVFRDDDEALAHIRRLSDQGSKAHTLALQLVS